MRRAPFLLALLLAAGPALGADALDAARAQAKAGQLHAVELRERQGALRAELEPLGKRIEALKAARKGPQLTGGELEVALRRSQELSGALTTVAAELKGAEVDAERGSQALLTALADGLTRLRADWDRAGTREERQALIARMRTLRAEREQLRAALGPTSVPALEPLHASDDPADLLEEADALRDREDKVRRRLATVSARLKEAHEERELDRRMDEFAGERSMFDEQDRSLRVERDPHAPLPAAADKRLFQADSMATSGTPEAQTAANEGFTAPMIGATPPRPTAGPRLSSPDVASDDLPSLEAQRAELESLARELNTRAAALESKARSLR